MNLTEKYKHLLKEGETVEEIVFEPDKMLKDFVVKGEDLIIDNESKNNFDRAVRVTIVNISKFTNNLMLILHSFALYEETGAEWNLGLLYGWIQDLNNGIYKIIK